jgi:thiol-disulfide isomerase/thioredoxin
MQASQLRSLSVSLSLAAAAAMPFSAVAQDQPTAKPEPAIAKPVMPEVTLKVGDKAPALSVEKWVKGSPVKAFEPGKTYVVEFWATWCGPCVASMPHLSEIQHKHKDKVTIIGMTSEDPNNSLTKVEEMVTLKGDGMGYTVAWDQGRSTNEAYMKAAARNGIPCSFVIDGTGTLAWIGHPMFLDIPLDLMVAGKWDAKTGAEAIAKAESAMRDVSMKAQSDPKAALEAYAQLEKDYPAVAAVMSDLPFTLSLQARDYDKAYTIGSKMVDGAIKSKDPAMLNMIAWTIVDPDADHEKRDLDLALRAAVKADEFSGGKDAAIIDTVARVHFLKGDVKKAIELQTKAVELAKGPMKDQLTKSLDEYKKKAGKTE